MLDTFHVRLTKLRQGRSDYAFHGYGELCNLVYCLLMKTRELSSLPGIHDWDSYMDVEKVTSASTRYLVSKGLCSFCPELMLEDDNKSTFDLFSELCGVLVGCDALSREESNAAVDEYNAYVIEKRRQHSRLERFASTIPDVRRYLLDDFGFQSRRHVLRVFKLFCLLVGESNHECPPLTIDLGVAGRLRGVSICAAEMFSHLC